uniref:Ig-like domain-containing protein n=1 Tax=Panagrolaimus superbus TaxID=310955 RepID=A0A914Y0W9_9BILA
MAHLEKTIEKGGLAHFEAVIKNATNVQWLFNGQQQLQSGQDGVKISQDDKFEFRLTLDSNKFESGRVTIKASNASDSLEQSAQMTVTQKAKESQTPSFTDQLKDISAEIGKPLSIDVIALNEPNFKWLLNGKPLEDGKDGIHILKDNNKSTLKIDEIKPEHAGTITVVAENEAGKSESNAKISVESAKMPAKISDGPKPVTATEKESVEFSTTVSGEPQPKVKWILNEKIIETSQENIILSSAGDKHTLRINDLKSEQSGKIEVRVENSVGSDSASTELKVKPAEIKPKFKATLSDSKVEAGKPLTFNVSLENPTPNTKVNWYLNGKKLETNDQIKVSEDGNGIFKLEISAATPDMNGTLTVRAENSQGSDENKARIEVTTGEREPQFSKTPRGDDVEEGAGVKFSAVISGVPIPEVEWYLNDQVIVSGDEIRIKYDTETGKTSIRIFKTKVEQVRKNILLYFFY